MIETVSLGEFAQLLGVSEPTLRKRLPEAGGDVIISRGKNGEAYEIDPRAGVEWWRSLAAQAEAERLARQEKLIELQLELIGPDTALGGHDTDGLTPGEQKAQLEAELAAIKLGELRGELVRASDVEAASARFNLAIKSKFTSLTDRLRKRAEISDDAALALDRLVQRDLHDLAALASEMEDATGVEAAAVANGRALPFGGGDSSPQRAAAAAENADDGEPVGDRASGI